MATTNIQIFDENKNKLLNDTQYIDCEERNNGFSGKLAKSTVFNKILFQISFFCKSIADFMVNSDYNASYRNVTAFKNNFKDSILSLMLSEVNARNSDKRQGNKKYYIGDVVRDDSFPLWAELECIEEGISSESISQNITAIGERINDGSVIWALRAKDFQSLLNTPIPFVGEFTEINDIKIPVHHVIGLPMLDYRFCDGSNGTIDLSNRFIMSKNSINEDVNFGGVDEVQIQRNNLPTGKFDLNLTCNNWEQNLKDTFKTGNNQQGHTHGAGDRADMMPLDGGIGGRMLTGSFPNTGGESNPHTHQVTVSLNATHNHSVSGNVVLNSNAQQKISVVSRHYKLAYIQRIY